MTTAEIQAAANDGARFSVADSGIAYYFRSVELERFWDIDQGIYPDDPDERETGNVVLVMIGDDREHSIDPDDVETIPDLDYCAECGQIGCKGDFRS